jgi:hypothetical protein
MNTKKYLRLLNLLVLAFPALLYFLVFCRSNLMLGILLSFLPYQYLTLPSLPSLHQRNHFLFSIQFEGTRGPAGVPDGRW